MTALVTVLTILLPILYLAVWADYLWLFYTEHPVARRTCSRAAAAVVILHMGVMVIRGVALQRLPMGTQAEFMSALALALLGTYLVVERRLRAKNTGFLTTGAAGLMMLSSAIFEPGAAQVNPLLSDPGFAGHAVLVLLSYTALSLSFLYAILYLVLARQLMRRRFGLLFRRLPALETLERMSVVSVEMGVPLLFLALALGHLWMYDLADRPGLGLDRGRRHGQAACGSGGATRSHSSLSGTPAKIADSRMSRRAVGVSARCPLSSCDQWARETPSRTATSEWVRWRSSASSRATSSGSASSRATTTARRARGTRTASAARRRRGRSRIG